MTSTNKNDRGAGTSAAVAPSNRKASVMASVRDWDDLVERGRQLKIQEERIDAEAGNIRWQWGDLALEVAPMGERGRDSGATDRLKRFADELDVSHSALREYRRVADAWPNAMRVAFQPWAVHQLFSALEDREELIATARDGDSGEVLNDGVWTYRAAQRFLGRKPSPHYRKPPATSAEKLAEIQGMVATVGDDEAVEFIDRVVDLLEAMEERTPTPRPSGVPDIDIPEKWTKAIAQLDGILTKLAKLSMETDELGLVLDGHAAMARYLYERISEKKLDAEIRQFLDAEAV